MYQEFIGQTMTFEQAYFTFEGYNFAMAEVEENERGTPFKGKVICVSNNPLELRSALELYDDLPCALLQGKMEDIDIPEVTLGREFVSGDS